MDYETLEVVTATLVELQRDPMGTLRKGQGQPVAVLNRNTPAFYVVPPEVYEALIEQLDDTELVRVVNSRLADPSEPISLDELLAERDQPTDQEREDF
jgi:antitoxin StbD|tara:strand:+ start:296 stop:589 length:294 start_codon:yes stop_codon:yes gene_type:complete